MITYLGQSRTYYQSQDSTIIQHSLWMPWHAHLHSASVHLPTCQCWSNRNLLQLRSLCFFWTLRGTVWGLDLFGIFWVFSEYNLNQSPLSFFNIIWFQPPIFPLCYWARVSLSVTRIGITSYCLSERDTWHPEFIYFKPQLKYTMLLFKSWSHHLQFSSFFPPFTHAPIPTVDWNQAFWLQPFEIWIWSVIVHWNVWSEVEKIYCNQC